MIGRSVFIDCDILDCGEQIILYGGATFVDLLRQARKDGWKASSIYQEHRCSIHNTQESREK